MKLFAFVFVVAGSYLLSASAQVPGIINYQGRVLVNGITFDGTGQFKFGLVDGAGTTTYWSQDGTSTGGAQPASTLSLQVANGQFTVPLGDTTISGMSQSIPSTVFANSAVYLRVWFNDGTNGFQQLNPDQRIAAVGYAMMAATAASANSVAAANVTGTFTLAQLPGVLVTNNQTGVTVSGTFSGNGGGLTNLQAAKLTGAGALPAGVLPSNVALLNSPSQTFTGVNLFDSPVGIGIASPFRTFQVRGGPNSVFGVFENGVAAGMTIESVNDANTINEPLEFRGNPNVFTTGNVVIGGTGSPEKLEVDGVDATIRIRNWNDIVGGFIGNTYSGLQMGMYNPSATQYGVLAPGEKRTLFAFDFNGNVGSVTRDFPNWAAYRNLLDDGGGNMRAAGSLYLPDTTPTAGIIYSGTSTLLHAFGSANVFLGSGAGNLAMSGHDDTSTGAFALASNTTGSDNTASGFNALVNNTTGDLNVADGASALASNTTGYQNTAVGAVALVANTTGFLDTAVGFQALKLNTTGILNTAGGAFALYANTTGNQNTATGGGALQNNTTGGDNTAVGFHALINNTANQNTAVGSGAMAANTDGSFNTANGFQALFSNTSGYDNTATGFQSLYSNTFGTNNTAAGASALKANTTGIDNTATGGAALYSNNSGSGNTGDGAFALSSNTTGYGNTGIGAFALYLNQTGFHNTAIGLHALHANTTGSSNTALGQFTLFSAVTANQNTGIGNGALYNDGVGTNNIALGCLSGYNVQGDNNIEIGNRGTGGDANVINIGTQGLQTTTSIAGIFGATSASGVPVYIDSNGQLGTLTSSARFKTDIRPMDDASDVLLALDPVTFRYRPDIDPCGVPQFGLIAEDVARIDPDLVTRDANQEVYTIRYEAVNAMLLNEFLKEHQQVQEQQHQIAEEKAQIDSLKDSIAELKELVKNLAAKK